MTTYRTALETWGNSVTVVRDPNDMTKDYQLPKDVAIVLYQAGKLEYDEYSMLYCTPGIDDPEIGLHVPLADG